MFSRWTRTSEQLPGSHRRRSMVNMIKNVKSAADCLNALRVEITSVQQVSKSCNIAPILYLMLLSVAACVAYRKIVC